MKEKKSYSFDGYFYILLGMSIAGTISLIILYSIISTYSACADDLIYESVRRIFVFFSLENAILFLYCFISLILAGKKKLINVKMILLIIFAILSSPVVYQFVQNIISNMKSSMNMEWNINGSVGADAKPILYVYPTEDMDLTIKLKNDNLITYSYPKYDNEWRVHATVDGMLYDYKTGRNYYALYWECINDNTYDMNEGFIVAGKDVVKFLEEKLSILGLNDREINEFIVYWLPKMESNKYNYIRFRTKEEINSYMPLEFSNNPDTLIRVYMDFKGLDKKVDVKEQKLTSVSREGFTVVEWGGREIN